MMKTLIKRSTAFALALVMLIGCGQFAVFATDTEETADVPVSAPIEVTPAEGDDVGGSSVSDATIEDVREILNAISYDEYSEKFANVARAEQSLFRLNTDGHLPYDTVIVHILNRPENFSRVLLQQISRLYLRGALFPPRNFRMPLYFLS